MSGVAGGAPLGVDASATRAGKRARPSPIHSPTALSRGATALRMVQLLRGGSGDASDEAGEGDEAGRVTAVRALKNAAIGHPQKKARFIRHGAVEALVDILARGGGEPAAAQQLLVQAAACLGSLGCGHEEGREALLRHGALDALAALWEDERGPPGVALAAIRAAKHAFEGERLDAEIVLLGREDNAAASRRHEPMEGAATAGQPYLSPRSVRRLVCVLAEGDDATASAAAVLLTRCAGAATPEVAEAACTLLLRPAPRCAEAALDAVAATVLRNPVAVAPAVASAAGVAERLLALLERPEALLRHMAARAVAFTCRGLREAAGAAGAPDAAAEDDPLSEAAACGAAGELGALLRPSMLASLALLRDARAPPRVREEVPLTMAALMERSPELQGDAAEAVQLLGARADLAQQPRERLACMLSLSLVASRHEAGRTAVASSAAAMRAVRRALAAEGSPAEATAACRCVAGLSRSVRVTRTSLADPDLARAVLRHARSAHPAVCAAASSALCNLVLDFSPVKVAVTEAGGIEVLAGLARSPVPGLRLNGAWGLKNLLFLAGPAAKEAVLMRLGLPQLCALAGDADARVRLQALLMVRNLAAEGGLVGHFLDDRHLQSVLGCVRGALEAGWAEGDGECVKQGLFVLCNVAAGGGRAKTLVARDRATLSTVREALSHRSPAVRSVAAWCVSNLAWEGPARARSFSTDAAAAESSDSASSTAGGGRPAASAAAAVAAVAAAAAAAAAEAEAEAVAGAGAGSGPGTSTTLAAASGPVLAADDYMSREELVSALKAAGIPEALARVCRADSSLEVRTRAKEAQERIDYNPMAAAGRGRVPSWSSPHMSGGYDQHVADAALLVIGASDDENEDSAMLSPSAGHPPPVSWRSLGLPGTFSVAVDLDAERNGGEEDGDDDEDDEGDEDEDSDSSDRRHRGAAPRRARGLRRGSLQ